jgi:hypothetical protein
MQRLPQVLAPYKQDQSALGDWPKTAPTHHLATPLGMRVSRSTKKRHPMTDSKDHTKVSTNNIIKLILEELSAITPLVLSMLIHRICIMKTSS